MSMDYKQIRHDSNLVVVSLFRKYEVDKWVCSNWLVYNCIEISTVKIIVLAQQSTKHDTEQDEGNFFHYLVSIIS